MTLPGPLPEYRPEQVAAAIKGARGLVSHAAKKLRCHPSTVYKYINDHSVCAQALEDARLEVGDDAENSIYNLIKRGDFNASRFYLTTVEKRRGYVERTEISGPDGAPLEIKITRVPNGRSNGFANTDAENE